MIKWERKGQYYNFGKKYFKNGPIKNMLLVASQKFALVLSCV